MKRAVKPREVILKRQMDDFLEDDPEWKLYNFDNRNFPDGDDAILKFYHEKGVTDTKDFDSLEITRYTSARQFVAGNGMLDKHDKKYYCRIFHVEKKDDLRMLGDIIRERIVKAMSNARALPGHKDPLGIGDERMGLLQQAIPHSQALTEFMVVTNPYLYYPHGRDEHRQAFAFNFKQEIGDIMVVISEEAMNCMRSQEIAIQA